MWRNLLIAVSALSLQVLGACDPAPLPNRASPTQPAPDDPVSNEPRQPPIPPAAPSYAPQPGDHVLTRGQVYMSKSQLLVAESFPP